MAVDSDQDYKNGTRQDNRETDQLRAITGVDENEEKAMENDAYSGAAEDIAEQQELSELGERAKENSEPGDKESSDSEQSEGGEAEGKERSIPFRRENESLLRFGTRMAVGKQKMAVIGGIAGLLIGAAFAIVAILSGPAQLVQLGRVLALWKAPASAAANVRFGNFLNTNRALETGDVGETRVGFLGSRRFSALDTELRGKGITINRDTATTGRPHTVSFDTTAGLDFSTIDRVAKYTGLDRGLLQLSSDGRFINADVTGLSNRRLRSLGKNLVTNTSFEALSDGTLATALNRRTLAKFWNTSSPLFHPIRSFSEGVGGRVDRGLQRIGTRWVEEGGAKARLVGEYRTAKTRLADAAGRYGGKVNAALYAQAGVCFLSQTADLIPLVNYAEVVVPSAVAATEKMAIGSQIESGQDVHIGELQGITNSLKDKDGKTIWEAKALNALANGTAGVGVDIEDALGQAFSAATTSGSILGIVDGWINQEIAGISLDRALCSTPALIVGGAAGIVLTIAGPGGWGVKSLTVSLSTAATLAASVFVQNFIVDAETETLNAADRAFGGPQGGNLYAFGGRAAANTTARQMGGVPLTTADEQAYLDAGRQREVDRFQSKNFFARLFDPYESRSLFGTAIQTAGGSQGSVFTKLLGTIMTPLSSFGSSLARLMPSASASAEEYGWGFPLYGIPLGVLENPSYEDPFANAEAVAGILESDTNDDLKEKAEKCFGVKVSKGAYGWEATPDKDVNPVEDPYLEADCSDSSIDWERLMVFILDNAVINAVDCFGPDEGKSCSKLAINAATNSNAGSTQLIPDCNANGGNAKIACVAIQQLTNIPYDRAQRAAPDDPSPRYLDCSALTGMAVYRAFGVNLGGIASVDYRNNPNFEEITDIRTIQPGDLVGRGTVATGAGGNGHIAIVVSYDPVTQKLITVESSSSAHPSGLRGVGGEHGYDVHLAADTGDPDDYGWAVRYIGDRTGAGVPL